MALEAAGFNVRPTDIVLTDNFEDDRDLVEAVSAPELMRSGPDLDQIDMPYVPFFYTARIKRTPGFFVKQVVLEELPIVILAYGLSQWIPDFRLWACLALLFAALILIYELGYAENDRVGEATEANPKLTENYYRFKDYRLAPGAWLYAIGTTVLAISCLSPEVREAALLRAELSDDHTPAIQILLLSLIWTVILGLVRVFFWVFNALPMWARVYWYVPLHGLKYLGLAVFFGFNPFGQILIFAHIVRTWALYAVRRSGGDMDAILSQTVRLIFVLLAVMLVALGNPEELLNWQAATILIFCIARAVPEARRKALIWSAQQQPS